MITKELTDRELEIVFWIANGKEPGDVGQILGVTSKRVNNALYELRQRLQCTTTSHLIALCMARGYLQHSQIYDAQRELTNKRWVKAVARFLTITLLVIGNAPDFDTDERVRVRHRLRRRESADILI